MDHGLRTVKFVEQMHEYLVNVHEASWNSDSICKRYDADPLFMYGLVRYIYPYQLLWQWY